MRTWLIAFSMSGWFSVSSCTSVPVVESDDNLTVVQALHREQFLTENADQCELNKRGRRQINFERRRERQKADTRAFERDLIEVRKR